MIVRPAAAVLPPGVPDAVPVPEWGFLQDEAITVLKELGKPETLTPAYARDEIRAYVFGRLIEIIDTDPADRTSDEAAAVDVFRAAVKSNRIAIARNAVTYYDSISDGDPCWGSPSPGATISPPPSPIVSVFCELFQDDKPNQREVYRGQGAAENYDELLTSNGRILTIGMLDAMNWFSGGAVHAAGPLFKSDTDAEKRYQDVMNFFRQFRDSQKSSFLLALLNPSAEPDFVIQALLVLGTTVWDVADFQVIGNDLSNELGEAQSATPDLVGALDGQLVELVLTYMGKVLGTPQTLNTCEFNDDYQCYHWNIAESDPDYTVDRYDGVALPSPDDDYYFAVKRRSDASWQTATDPSPYPQGGPGARMWAHPVPGSSQLNGELSGASTRLQDPVDAGIDDPSELRLDAGSGLSSFLSDGFLVHTPVDDAPARDTSKWKYGTTLKYRNWLGEYWRAMFVDGTFLQVRDGPDELEGTAQVAGFVQHDGGTDIQDGNNDGYTYCKAWTNFTVNAGSETYRERDYRSVDGRCVLLSRDFDASQVSVGDRIEIGGSIRTIQHKVNCEGTDLDNTGFLIDLFVDQLYCDEGDPGHEPLDPATLNWGRTALIVDQPLLSLTGDGLSTGPSRRFVIRKLDETNTCPSVTTGLDIFGRCEPSLFDYDPRDFQHCPRFGEPIDVDAGVLSDPDPEYVFDDTVWSEGGDFTPLDCYYSPMIRYQGAQGEDWQALYVPDGEAFDDSYRLAAGADTLEIPRARGVIGNDQFPSTSSITDKSGYTATLTDDVDHGSLDFSADGSFTYTRGTAVDDAYNCGPPGSPYCGPDSFDYEVCADRDDGTDCDTATVQIEVENAAPQAYDVGFESGDGEYLATYTYYDLEGDPEVLGDAVDGTVFKWTLEDEYFVQHTVTVIGDNAVPDTVVSAGVELGVTPLEVEITPKASRGSWPQGPDSYSSEDNRETTYIIRATCSTNVIVTASDEAECVFKPFLANLPYATDLSFELRLTVDIQNLGFNFTPRTCVFSTIDGFSDVGTHTCTATLQRDTDYSDSGKPIQGVAQIYIDDNLVKTTRTDLMFYRGDIYPGITVTANTYSGGTAGCTPNPVAPAGSDSVCTAAANSGWRFAGWTGDCTSAATQCTLRDVEEDKTVQATFLPEVDAQVLPSGAGTVECTPNPVPLTGKKTTTCIASANEGFAFSAWTGDGDCNDADSLCRIDDISGPISLTANFVTVDPHAGVSLGSSVPEVSVAATNGWTMTSRDDPTNPSLGWTSLTGSPNSPDSPPPDGTVLVWGVLSFVLEGGTPGSSAEVTITYPEPLPADTAYWKYDRDADHWYALDPSRYVVSGNTITLFLTDGEQGDHDGAVNGLINDPGGPVEPDTDKDGIGNSRDDDDDNDGIPDDFEINNGLDPLDDSDGNADRDHDKLTNLQEYELGTDLDDPDFDGDGIMDGLDPEPTSYGNICAGFGMPSRVTVESVLVPAGQTLVCGVSDSITVKPTVQVAPTGRLVLIAPRVTFKNGFSVPSSGGLTVIPDDPTPPDL